MRNYWRGIVVVLCVLISTGVNGKDRDVCEWRADIVKSVAEQRDKGASKAAMKKALLKAIPQFPAFFIDMIWQHPELSPIEIAARDFELCLKTP
jgi:hypothetical protein